MGAEMDRLEIAVEAEASRALKALEALESQLNKMGDKLGLLNNINFSKATNREVREARKSISDLDKVAEKTGKQMSASLIKNFNLGKASNNIKKEVSQLVHGAMKEVASGEYGEGFTEGLKRLADVIKKNGGIAKQGMQDYEDLYNSIVKLKKLNISEMEASSIPDFNKRKGIMRNVSTNGELPLDTAYSELADKYQGILPPANEMYSTADMFMALSDAVDTYKQSLTEVEQPANWDEMVNFSVIDEFNEAEKVIQNFKDAKDEALSKPFDIDVDTSDISKANNNLKYTLATAEELQEKFKNAGINKDFSSTPFVEVSKAASAYERQLDKLYNKEEQMVAVNGSDKLGTKQWHDLQFTIARVSNEYDNARQRLEVLNAEHKKTLAYMGELSRGSGNSTIPDTSSNKSNANSGGKYEDYSNNKGLDLLKKSLADLDRDMNAAIPSANAFRQAMRLDSLEEGAKKMQYTAATMDELQAKFRDVGANTNFSDMGFKEAEKAAAQYSKTLDTLYARMDRTIGVMGTDSIGGKAWYNLQYDIARTSNQLEGVKKRINELSSQSGGKLKSLIGTFKQIGSAGQKAFSPLIRILGKLGNAVMSGLGKISSSIPFLNKAKSSAGGLGITSNGLAKSIFKLGNMFKYMVTKMAIRAAIEGAKQGFQNLSQYSQQTNRDLSMIVSGLLQLKNSFAVAFAPILSVVAPILSKLISLLVTAMNAVGRFFAALTGKKFAAQAVKVNKDYATSLGGAASGADKANKAMKDYQKTILGFDELNVLNSPTEDNSGGGGGAGGGGGGDIGAGDMFETVSLDDKVSEFAKKLREAFLKEDWEELGRLIGEAINKGFEKLDEMIKWENVGGKITKAVNAITTTFNSLVSTIDWALIGRTFGDGINTIVNTLNLLLEGIDWKNLGASFATGINSLFTTIDWKNLGNLLGNKFMVAWNVFYGLVTNLDFASVGVSLGEGINGIFEKINWQTIAATLSGALNGLGETILNFTKTVDWTGIAKDFTEGLNSFLTDTDWGQIASSLSQFLLDALGGLITALQTFDWGALGTGIIDFILGIDWIGLAVDLVIIGAELIGGIIEGAVYALETLGQSLIDATAEAFGAVKDGVKEKLGEAKDWASKKAEEIKTAVSDKWNTLKENCTESLSDLVKNSADKWEDIKTAFSNFDDYLSGIFETDWSESFGALGEVFNGFLATIKNIWESIKRVFNGITEFVKGVFSGDWEQAWDGIKEIFGGIWDGMVSLLTSPINSIIGLINGMISGVVAGMNAVGDVLNSFSIDIPDWVPGIGGGSLGFNVPYFYAPQIPYLASGGFPAMGQLFVANEKGPEMIGQMNGKRNVVANNNQIVEGIKAGVVDAMMEVGMLFGGNNNNSEPPVVEVSVFADSEQLARVVKQGTEKSNRRYETIVPIVGG